MWISGRERNLNCGYLEGKGIWDCGYLGKKKGFGVVNVWKGKVWDCGYLEGKRVWDCGLLEGLGVVDIWKRKGFGIVDIWEGKVGDCEYLERKGVCGYLERKEV